MLEKCWKMLETQKQLYCALRRGLPRQLARTQMVRTELAKTRPRAGEADITRQVEKITST